MTKASATATAQNTSCLVVSLCFSECFPAKQIAARNRMIPAMIAMAYPAVVRPPSFVTIKLNIKKDTQNTDLANAILEKISSEEKYNITIGYNKSTGIIETITIVPSNK